MKYPNLHAAVKLLDCDHRASLLRACELGAIFTAPDKRAEVRNSARVCYDAKVFSPAVVKEVDDLILAFDSFNREELREESLRENMAPGVVVSTSNAPDTTSKFIVLAYFKETDNLLVRQLPPLLTLHEVIQPKHTLPLRDIAFVVGNLLEV